jgi:transcription elongation GreA/GreB family factor
MSIINIKINLIENCRSLLIKRIDILKKNIDQAQNEANQHKGAMQSRYDTFKEEAQYLKGGYEKPLEGTLVDLSLLNSIPFDKMDIVQFGSILKTSEKSNQKQLEEKRYFIFASISNEPISVDNYQFICISPNSPLGQALIGFEIGEQVDFRDKIIDIIDII